MLSSSSCLGDEKEGCDNIDICGWLGYPNANRAVGDTGLYPEHDIFIKHLSNWMDNAKLIRHWDWIITIKTVTLSRRPME